MNMKQLTVLVMSLVTVLPALALAQPKAAAPEPTDAPPPTRITDLTVQGRIDGANIGFDIDMAVTSYAVWQQTPIVSGHVVLDKITEPAGGFRPHFEPIKTKAGGVTYHVLWPRSGDHQFKATFAARANPVQDGQWRETTIGLPAARLRQIQIVADRTDLQVQFPGAMRVVRQVVDGQLTMTALLGPKSPLVVRWKPLVEVQEAKLVLGSTANTIATVGVGALRIDSFFQFDIAQGKLNQLTFNVPKSLSITQVRGQHIRDWRIAEPAEGAPDDAPRTLTVSLNRAQDKVYALQVLAEQPLPALPTEIDLPVTTPTLDGVGIRAGGQVAVGTNSAIQLVVRQAGGLSQIDGSGFTRVALDAKKYPRAIPSSKSFFYQFAASPYQLRLALDDVVPTFDVEHMTVVRVKEDDLVVGVNATLDIRDAPIRSAVLELPVGLDVTQVDAGRHAVEHAVLPRPADAAADDPQRVELTFTQPVIGKVAISVVLKLGQSPFGQVRNLRAPSFGGARSQRGHVAVAVDPGVQLADPVVQNLREVSTASIQQRVADTQFVYRLRAADWTLGLTASAKPADVRVETFHLLTLADSIATGSVAVTYFITGSPIDRLQFRVSPRLQNVEFVGADVRRWSRDENDPQLLTVELKRKVDGPYNLLVTYTQRYDDETPVTVGGVAVEQTQTQMGYMVVASHRNVKLSSPGGPEAGGAAVLAIDRQEVPAGYRLMVQAPILRTYKYVAAPHEVVLNVQPYTRVSLPNAVVEVMQMSTQVYVDDAGPSESQTRVRYVVKNASEQFLPLSMPKGAANFKVYEPADHPDEEPRRVGAVFDKQRGMLLVPLDRKRNPNHPITLEVEYGLDHRDDSDGGVIQITAPTSDLRSTFDRWGIHAPKDWALLPVENEGNMVAQHREQTRGDLSLVMDNVTDRWRAAISRWLDDVVICYAVLAVAAMVLVFAFRRQAVVDAAAWIVLVGLFWIGVVAAGVSSDPAAVPDTSLSHPRDVLSYPQGGQPDNWQSLTHTQAVGLENEAPLSVAVQVVPAWRQHAPGFAPFGIAVFGLACFFLAVALRKLRWVLVSVGVVALLFAAARFPHATPILGHLLTWGVPVLLAIGFALVTYCCRSCQTSNENEPESGASDTPPLPGGATVAGLALAFMLVFANTANAQPAADAPTIEKPQFMRCEATMVAGNDSVDVGLNLRITAAKPMRLPVLNPASIMLSPEKTDGPVRVVSIGGQTFVNVKQAGTYDLQLRFLSPLPPADAQQRRTFSLGLPAALTNQVVFTIPNAGLEVLSPTAMRFGATEADGQTTVNALFGPGDTAVIAWKPRERRTEIEKTVLFADVATAVRFEEGVVQAAHDVSFQIAQGQLSDIKLAVPQNMIVTAVQGVDVGAWRFDPATNTLEVRLSKPATGEYRLRTVTQVSTTRTPYDVSVGGVRVIDAVRQRGTMGLLESATVHVRVDQAPASMNVDDFTRDAAALIHALATQRNSGGGQAAARVRHAYRIRGEADVVQIRATRIEPEYRSREMGVFTVADQRLAYNTNYYVEVSKAGVFSATLNVPAEYEIDELSAPQVSHWDEEVVDGQRVVQVQFKGRMLGVVNLRLLMSRPEPQLPQQVTLPRVVLVGASKHDGRIVIESEQGVRLAVAAREGVNERDPLRLDPPIRQPAGVLVFDLLRSDWALQLTTEVIEPRVNVDFLHVAEVSESVVYHTHHLRYSFYNAGVKTFEIDVPQDASSVLISGPFIARREQVEPGRWRIELEKKVFNNHVLTVTYEDRFDRGGGAVALRPVAARDVDQQTGHVVVMANDRVELGRQRVGATLEPVNARTIERGLFGADDLSSAAFAYFSASPAYDLAMTVRRHAAADLLEADVRQADVTSVVADSGTTINRVEVYLSVGSKRHLEARLPKGATVWSLLVDGRATAPSTRTDSKGNAVLLIPLPPSPSREMVDAKVDLIYVAPPAAGWSSGQHDYRGPRFDLPLRSLTWRLLLPIGFDYDDFEGTLAVDDQTVDDQVVHQYGLSMYQQQMHDQTIERRRAAGEQIQISGLYAQQGEQVAAINALQKARDHAQQIDAALSEDYRQQHNLLVYQNAMVGLRIANRRLYDQSHGAATGGRGKSDRFLITPEQLRHFPSSLNKHDSDNLKLIVRRIIASHEAAGRADMQLSIVLPQHGRELRFIRAVQVQPNADMQVSFTARRAVRDTIQHGWLTAGGLVVVFALLMAGLVYVGRRLPRWRACCVTTKSTDVVVLREEAENDAPSADATEPDKGDS